MALEEGKPEPFFPWKLCSRAAEAASVSQHIPWARGSRAATTTTVNRYHPWRVATRAAETIIGKPQSPLERGDPRGRNHSRETGLSSRI